MLRVATAAAVLLPALLLGAPLQGASAVASKHACAYDDPLCGWTPRYMFGSAVIGDKAFFHGGLLSNDRTRPVSGSQLDVLDLCTLAPHTAQVQESRGLNSSRYRHHLLARGQDRLLVVGGQQDDEGGISQMVLSVIELDLSTRLWRSVRNFTQPGGRAELIFEAAAVAGEDVLLIVYAKLSPEDPARMFAALDLETNEIINGANYALLDDVVRLLDMPLVSVASLGDNGDFPHLVVMAYREMRDATANSIAWMVVTGDDRGPGVEGPVPFSVSTDLPKAPGGGFGKVLSLSIIQVADKQKLVLWASTNATFQGVERLTQQQASAVLVYDLTADRGRAAARLSDVFVVLPANRRDLAGLQSVDLPMTGRVRLRAAQATAIPYVGTVDLVGELDRSNVNIQPWANKGFVIRGSGKASIRCQTDGKWRPFVVAVELPAAGRAVPPVVRAVSNLKWCGSKGAEEAVANVTRDALALQSNAKLHLVSPQAPGGQPLLMLLNSRVISNPGGQLSETDTKSPRLGAYVDVARSRSWAFNATAPPAYPHPAGYASCVMLLGGQPAYVEHGGSFNGEGGERQASSGVYVMPLDPSHGPGLKGGAEHAIVAAGGAAGLPAVVHPAMACGPGGALFVFGGVEAAGRKDRAGSPAWAATSDLRAVKLVGSASALKAAGPATLLATSHTSVSPRPGPRSGHVMLYLPAAVVAKLGMRQGALLLHGGSDMAKLSLPELLATEDPGAAMRQLANRTVWDRATWLYDIAGDRWTKLAAAGAEDDAPPPLMYHSAALHGNQAMLFGGLELVPGNQTGDGAPPSVRTSTDLFVLDFSEAVPRWRRAAVGNLAGSQGANDQEHPNTGIAPLPGAGAVALMHRAGISLTAIPQSLDIPASELGAPGWASHSTNLTAGDWVRVLPVTPTGWGVKLQRPLALAGGYILSASSGSAEPGAAEEAPPRAAGGAGRAPPSAAGAADKTTSSGASAAEESPPQAAGAAGKATPSAAGAADKTTSSGASAAEESPPQAAGAAGKATPSAAGAADTAPLTRAGAAEEAPPPSMAGAAEEAPPPSTPGGARGSARGLLQQDSPPVLELRCGRRGMPAVAFSSGGAVLENAIISGCSGAAVMVEPTGQSGAYDSPAVMRNVAVTGNAHPHGAAVRVAPGGAWLELQGCTVSANNASGGAIGVGPGSRLGLVGTTVEDNAAGGVVFNGTRLDVRGCLFARNRAASRGAGAGGALKLACANATGASRCVDQAEISGSQFVGNSAAAGGAVFLGPDTSVVLINTSFDRNAAARDGGAMFASEDACLGRLERVEFTGNEAGARGGAAFVRSPGCRDLQWRRLMLLNNSAGEGGGALHVTELTRRNLTMETVIAEHNTATNESGNGGAVFIGAWSSSVQLRNSSLRHNRCSGSGGAVHVVAMDSELRIDGSQLSDNIAGGAAAGTPLVDQEPGQWASSVRSEGGALFVQGGVANVTLVGVAVDANQAGRGGAVSMASDAGSFSATNSTFGANVALVAGGAVAVTARKSVALSNATFDGNRLLWPGLAAGGGLYCFLCEHVDISRSHFTGNRASYGGGAALLQPARTSHIVDTLFAQNTALPDPRRLPGRAMLAAGLATGAVPDAAQAVPQGAAADAGADMLGPVGSNTTGDSGLYVGGGGLYASVSGAGALRLNGSAFARNQAQNGGGLLARTDMCRPGAGCRLVLLRVAVRGDNAAPAGAGLLVTDIQRSVAELADCAAGDALSEDAVRACLQPDNKLSAAWAEARARRRLLLSASTGGAPPAQQQQQQQQQQQGADGASDDAFFASSAADMVCMTLRDPASGPGMELQQMLQRQDCDEPIEAAPGLPFAPAFQLLDGLGRNITGSALYDTRVPMEAVVEPANGSKATFELVGSTARAVNGVVAFSRLAVNAPPGQEYRLTFQGATSLLRKTRMLRLRKCRAGEYTLSRGENSYMCDTCQHPTFSFYPEASHCSSCGDLEPHSVAKCSGAVVLPANGWYQSHPRSPLLHRCISSSACRRDDKVLESMAVWAADHASLNATQLNARAVGGGAPLYEDYTRHMCAEGHTGPLCGACIAERGTGRWDHGFGRSGDDCVSCLPKPVNDAAYFLVCLAMFLIPVAQMVLHSKTVRRRQAEAQNGRTAGAAAGVPPAAGLLPEALPPSLSGKNSWQGRGPSGGRRDDYRAAAGDDTAFQGDQVLRPLPSVGQLPSPFSAPAQQYGYGGRQQGFSGSSRATSGRLHSGPVADKTSSSFLERLFGVESLDDCGANVWSTSFSASAPPGGNGGGTSLAYQPAAAALVAPAGRHAGRFWHADVLTMLVSYMQLLGLLRLVQVNWHQLLRDVLTYLDFTSAASTWISLECSIGEGRLPRSVWRSVALLLWPVAALLLLCICFLAYALASTWRRAGTMPLRTILRQLLPHAVMAFVIMLHFLYTPTSREIIGLFSCQPVDSEAELRRRFPEASTPEAQWQDARAALVDSSPYKGWKGGAWTSDTNVMCGSPNHLWLVFGFGVLGLALFVVGLPVALWVVLRAAAGPHHARDDASCEAQDLRGAPFTVDQRHSRLSDPEVELRYGLMYERYRVRRYYWECVVLLENGVLTLLLVMLQDQAAPLQVLVAMGVIFIEATLHFTFQPYACRMLDTLRRLAVYGLMGTLFMLMLVSLGEYEREQALTTVVVVMIFAVNLFVVAVHLWACGCELRRWLLHTVDKDGKGRLTWADARRALLGVCSCGRLQGGGGGAGAAGAGGAGAAVGAARKRGPPKEYAVGSINTVHSVTRGVQPAGPPAGPPRRLLGSSGVSSAAAVAGYGAAALPALPPGGGAGDGAGGGVTVVVNPTVPLDAAKAP